MATEIERKFLVTGSGWQSAVRARQAIRQFYLARTKACEIRVRIVDQDRASLTIKSAAAAVTRREVETAMAVADALALLPLKTGSLIEKTRHLVDTPSGTWEIDVFKPPHDGLVLAEIELSGVDAEVHAPGWLGAEVTGDPRYYNATLAGLSGAGLSGADR